MNDLDLIKLLGQSGVAVVALLLLARVVSSVGDRMIKAIDAVTAKIDEHTKEDKAALAAVGDKVTDLRQDIAVLRTSVDVAIDWSERTPVGANEVESLPVHRADHRSGRVVIGDRQVSPDDDSERRRRSEGGTYSMRPRRGGGGDDRR